MSITQDVINERTTAQNEGCKKELTPEEIRDLDQRIAEAIHSEYLYYNTEIKTFVATAEILMNGDPDSLYNEVRNAFGHIASAATQVPEHPGGEDDTRLANVRAAHSHLRRVALDARKLMCIGLIDSIKQFQHQFRFYNLRDVDDGQFLIKLNNLSKAARAAHEEAKSSDNSGKNSDNNGNDINDVYEKYENSYNAFVKVIDYIEEHYVGIMTVARQSIWKTVFSVMGWAISVGLAVLFFFLGK